MLRQQTEQNIFQNAIPHDTLSILRPNTTEICSKLTFEPFYLISSARSQITCHENTDSNTFYAKSDYNVPEKSNSWWYLRLAKSTTTEQAFVLDAHIAS